MTMHTRQYQFFHSNGHKINKVGRGIWKFHISTPRTFATMLR
jgi:hypothetical protein